MSSRSLTAWTGAPDSSASANGPVALTDLCFGRYGSWPVLDDRVVHDWRRRHPDFPQPIARLALGYVWAWSDVAAWARSTGRL